MHKLACLVSVAAVTVLVGYLYAESARPYEQVMKEVGAACGSLKKNLDAKMSQEAARDAEKLAALFKEVEAFWTKKNVQDATGFAQNAQAGAKETFRASHASNMEGALAAFGNMTKNCKSCHDAHREKLADGSYRIK